MSVPRIMAQPLSPTQPLAVRRSPSPPSQPISKRDKRRNMIDSRMKDLAASFSQNRDTHVRTQLAAISRDIHYITRVEAYQNKLLDDYPDDLVVEVSSTTGMGESERIHLGRTGTVFVDYVNNEMELRDALITEDDLAYQNYCEQLKLEIDFSLEVADAESQVLKDMARQRVVNAVQAKKRNIAKEKEQLDTADSTYLMNTHALTALTTTPGSPSGGYASRKTRYTRNRQDPEGLTDGAEAGVANGKRKRKVAGADLDYESPGPSGNAAGLRNTPLQAGSALWSEKGKGGNSTADEGVTVATADSFFTARELSTANRTAHANVAQAWTDRRPRYTGVNGANGKNSGHADGNGTHNGERAASTMDDDELDYSSLMAPAMDRTANSSTHATRSTRLAQPATSMAAAAISAAAAAAAAANEASAGNGGSGGGHAMAREVSLVGPPGATAAPDWEQVKAATAEDALEHFDDPRRVYGLAVLEALSIRPKGVTSSNKDIEAPLTRELPIQQVQEDLAVIQSLVDAPDD